MSRKIAVTAIAAAPAKTAIVIRVWIGRPFRKPWKNTTTASVIPPIITKSNFSMMRRNWAKISPPIIIPHNPILIPGDGSKLTNATNNNAPSNPVNAAPLSTASKGNGELDRGWMLAAVGWGLIGVGGTG